MSKLVNDTCGNALDALRSLFRSDRFSEQDLHNSSAFLSQKGMETKQQTLDTILKHMLNEWGIGFDAVIVEDGHGVRTWVYDSISYLTKNKGIIGFMMKHTNENWRVCKLVENTWEWQKNKMEWIRMEKHLIIDKIMSSNCPAYILWKQWIPLKRWISQDRPFYVRSPDMHPTVRWEYEPTSCWNPQRMNYQGKDKTIAKILKKWSTRCLISNGKQFIVLTPKDSGWNQEIVMEFDGLPISTVSTRLIRLTMDQIEAYMDKNISMKKEVSQHLAHALTSVASKFGIKIHHKRLSAFQMDDDQEESLKDYEKNMKTAINNESYYSNGEREQ